MVILALAVAAFSPDLARTERQPVTPHDLVEVAEIMGPSLSPDGKRVAYRVTQPRIDTNDVRQTWLVVDVDGGAPVAIGNGGSARHNGAGVPIDESPIWDRDSRGIRYLARENGVVSIWHWREGGSAEIEISDPADITSFGLAADAASLRYTVGATREAVAAAERQVYEEGALVDARLDLNQPIAGGMIEDGKRIMQRYADGWFDFRRILWDAPAVDKTRHIEDGAQLPTAAASPQQGLLVIAEDGSRAEISRTPRQRVIVTRTDGRKVACALAACRSPSLTALAWRPGSNMLLLFDRQGSGREIVRLWRIGSNAVKDVATTDGSFRNPVRPDRCVAARAAMVCAEGRPTVPPRLVRIGYSGERKVIDDPNRELADRISAKATPLGWEDGVSGVFLAPANSKQPLPVVVHYYNCNGFLKGGTGDEIPMLPLVEAGIAVLCIDGKRAPREAGMEASYDLALLHIGRALDELAATGKIDPAHVGIGGLSFGSSVALWGVRKSKRFAAATVASGQISPQYYWINALPDRGFAAGLKSYWGIGDPDSDRKRWTLASPVWDVASITTPLLLQVPQSEIQTMVEFHTRMRLAGKPIELHAFADELHIKYQPVHKLATSERNLDWFRFWLKGEESDAPGKAAQYARWRPFREGQSLPAPAP